MRERAGDGGAARAHAGSAADASCPPRNPAYGAAADRSCPPRDPAYGARRDPAYGLLRPASVRRWVVLLGPAALAAAFLLTGSAQQPSTLGPLGSTALATYFVADGMPGSEFRDSDRDLALWALGDWERATRGGLRFMESTEDEALVRIYWVPARAGQYGEARPILVDGRRGAEVFIRPDVSALGPDIARAAALDSLLRDTIVYLTCLHEIGHALGLGHTADYADIMYFFGFGGDIPGFFARYRDRLERRRDIELVTGLSATDAARVRGLYPATTFVR